MCLSWWPACHDGALFYVVAQTYLQTEVARMLLVYVLHAAVVVEIVAHARLHVYAGLWHEVELHAGRCPCRELRTVFLYVSAYVV